MLDRSDPKVYHDQLTALRLVCGNWNTLIECWGNLWTIISIRLPLETARKQLTRSGDRLLQVDMIVPPETFTRAFEVTRWRERTEALSAALLPDAGRISGWRITDHLVLAGPNFQALLFHPLPRLAELQSQKPRMEDGNPFGLVPPNLRNIWTPAQLTPFINRLVEGVEQEPLHPIHVVVHATFVSLRSPHLHLHFDDISISDVVEVTAASISERKVSVTMRGRMPSDIPSAFRGLSPAVVELILEEEGGAVVTRILTGLYPQRLSNGEISSMGWVFPELHSVTVHLPPSAHTTSQLRAGIYRELLRELKQRSRGRAAGAFQVAPARPVALRLSGARGGLTPPLLAQLRSYASEVVVE